MAPLLWSIIPVLSEYTFAPISPGKEVTLWLTNIWSTSICGGKEILDLTQCADEGPSDLDAQHLKGILSKHSYYKEYLGNHLHVGPRLRDCRDTSPGKLYMALP